MADYKGNNDNQANGQVVGDKEEYEASNFAEETGISVEQAVTLIEKFGHDRETLEREARKLA